MKTFFIIKFSLKSYLKKNSKFLFLLIFILIHDNKYLFLLFSEFYHDKSNFYFLKDIYKLNYKINRKFYSKIYFFIV
jgi:hypothetical protein